MEKDWSQSPSCIRIQFIPQKEQSVSQLKRRNFKYYVVKRSLFIVCNLHNAQIQSVSRIRTLFIFTAIEKYINLCALCQRMPDLKCVLFSSLKFVYNIFICSDYSMNKTRKKKLADAFVPFLCKM